ncbi:GTP binding protein [Nowakowskiella sp. JEL0407]|nr:GTP binding protein [Nowakowskiella sp. JEL0407]
MENYSFLASNLSISTISKSFSLPSEIEEGNIEYKFKLITPDPSRIVHLSTQLAWRLTEGNGVCYYEIGVGDDGEIIGLDEFELTETLRNLKLMAEGVGLHTANDIPGYDESSLYGVEGSAGREEIEMSINHELQVSDTKKVVEVQFKRSIKELGHVAHLRIAMLGGYDSGKSTLLGLLTHSEFDNGRGKSRLNLLRHLHEIESGRTSSISTQIIGFENETSPDLPDSQLNAPAQLINYSVSGISSWQDIIMRSKKVVTFFDMCGHPKYQKTTISALSSLGLQNHTKINADEPITSTYGGIDYACLLVPSNLGALSEISKEHLWLSLILKIPVLIVITKIDVSSEAQVLSTMKGVVKVLKSAGKEFRVIANGSDADKVNQSEGFGHRVVPIFLISNVTGENIGLFTHFLNNLKKRNDITDALDPPIDNDDVEFQIEEIFNVPDVGCVLGGTLLSGKIDLRSQMSTTPGSPRSRLSASLLGSSPKTTYSYPVSSSPKTSSYSTTTSPTTTTNNIYYIGPHRGKFIPVQIISIQKQRCDVLQAVKGESVTFAVRFSAGEDGSYDGNATIPTGFKIRRGQVLVGPFPIDIKSSFNPSLTIPMFNEIATSSDEEPEISTPMSTPNATPYTFHRLPSIKNLMNRMKRSSKVPRVVWEFEAEMNALNDSKSFTVGNKGVVYCGSVRQGVKVISIETDGRDSGKENETKEQVLKNGQKGRVTFRFSVEPEFVRVGWTVLFRDGSVKGIGKVVRVVEGE